MQATDKLFDTLKDLMATSNLGLVTRKDLARLEERVDEVLALVDELEKRLPKVVDEGE